MSVKNSALFATKTTGKYQQTPHCNQIMSFIKTTGQNPLSPLTYSKIMCSPKFAGVFSVKDKLSDVRKYFVNVHKSNQRVEKLQLLKSIELTDFELSLEKILEITPVTAVQNQKLITALSQFEQDNKHTIFALRIPSDIAGRKEIIHCKKNLQIFRDYLYLEHDILVTKTLDLMNALYVIYIFEKNQKSPVDSQKESVANAEIENKDIKKKIFQVGNNAMKFSLHFKGDKGRSEALHLQSIIKANGGACILDSSEADKVILVGDSNDYALLEELEKNCHIYSTGLIWQAIGTGIYDPSKDVRFLIKDKDSQKLDQGSEQKMAKLSSKGTPSEENPVGNANSVNTSQCEERLIVRKSKVFDGREFYVFCGKKGEVNKRNLLWKLIRENGGILRSTVSEKTINVFLGQYELDCENQIIQDDCNWYCPKLVTEAVELGTFREDGLELYKYKVNNVRAPNSNVGTDKCYMETSNELVVWTPGADKIELRNEMEENLATATQNVNGENPAKTCNLDFTSKEAENSPTACNSSLDLQLETLSKTTVSPTETFDNDNLTDCGSKSGNPDKVAIRFACYLEELEKRPEENDKKIAEYVKSVLLDKFQDEVAIKTVQNNIRMMFLQWDREGQKFEDEMLKIGVSQNAINYAKKFKKL